METQPKLDSDGEPLPLPLIAFVECVRCRAAARVGTADVTGKALPSWMKLVGGMVYCLRCAGEAR